MAAQERGDLVKLGVARDEVEAGIWRDLLEKEGIPLFLKSLDPLSPFGVAPMPGSIEAYVLARDEKRARWILGQLQS